MNKYEMGSSSYNALAWPTHYWDNNFKYPLLNHSSYKNLGFRVAKDDCVFYCKGGSNQAVPKSCMASFIAGCTIDFLYNRYGFRVVK